MYFSSFIRKKKVSLVELTKTKIEFREIEVKAIEVKAFG